MIKIHDESERLRALDPKQSFIVQAPAGSGKTELLIQRFLVLLSTVQQPEEILAITFTKKSAAEMRDRIINALKNAQETSEPETTHAKKTWQLAHNVLQQDNHLKWNLLANPNRLRLQTIDSFNASLTHHLPMLSHFGAPAEITDDPYPLYRHAVREFLSHLEEDQDWSDAIAVILLHMDNDLNKVESLLMHLLAKRDQWLRHMTLYDDASLRKKCEEQLEFISIDTLRRLKNDFPKQHQEELLHLLRYASQHVDPSSAIACCAPLENLPGDTIDDIKYWLGIRELLFTKSDEWRKKLEKNIGFPPASSMKHRAIDLIDQLSKVDSLKILFKELKNLPDLHYKESQWETLKALHYSLRIIAAQLKLTFQQYGKIDYIENALAALTALGTDESPTSLTLSLDYQIKHILVDEFQDTSNSQYHLLKKITMGWQPNDGRTLFLVGDPMQSIYRFREAEVGIFIRTKKYGIGHIPLESITLSVNFRSTPIIVNWINEHFQTIFPREDDISTGAVPYSPSRANQEKENNVSAVSINAFIDAEKKEQADGIVSLIQQRKKSDPTGTIAILVRSRTHLEYIIPTLKEAGIPYRAIDIDPLTQRPLIQDLMGLTRALLQLTDRIAWLTVLRAPWCGLSLSDLLQLSGNNPAVSLWERCQSAEVIHTLSAEGQTRLNRFLNVMKIKIPDRERYSLHTWIESTWLLLGGPACVQQSNELEDAAAYFALLNKLNQDDSFDLDSLENYVNRLYATPDDRADESLQIMTIHNAKGLEFDTVILPHLESKAPVDDKQLLLWMERIRSDENHSLILAPVHAIGHDTDSIYEYIKQENAIKNDYERSRLLYVAATRTKKHLDLFFNLKKESKIYSSSLLEKLWPSIQNNVTCIEKSPSDSSLENTITYAPIQLKRLSMKWENPIQENRSSEKIAYHQKQFGFLLPDYTAKYAGIVVHQILQQISQWGMEWWQTQSIANQLSYLKMHLSRLGVEKNHVDEIRKKIHAIIENTLEDPRGRWILFEHPEAQSEFHLTAVIDAVPKQFIIDRTFVDDNIRWIIDYKTATLSAQENLQTFLSKEQEKYQQQMWYYFRAIREIDRRPIRMGLYFPTLSAWHEWEFEKETII